ncbi:MAG: exo-alpha-sialidase, partial [Anaerolineales bacterium]
MHLQERKTSPAPNAMQTAIYFHPESYSAFPHIVRLAGEELLVSFREAPRVAGIQHTHPRSIISIIRSYDSGMTWDIGTASQLGAGGGQEFSLISFGRGHVAGALAWHEVVPVHEKARTNMPHVHPNEYPFRTPGACWAWSDSYGFTWPPHQIAFFGPGTMPCGPPQVTYDGMLLCSVYGVSSGGMSSVLYRSSDQGRSWSEPVVIAQGVPGVRDYCEPCAVEIAPGVLRTLHRVENSPDGDRCFWS